MSEIPVTTEELTKGGTRADAGKSGVDMIPAEVLVELGNLYTYGAKKYTRDNWRRGMNYSRMYASLMRHLLAFWSGEAMDAEGFHHLDAVIWGAVGLRYFELYPDTYAGFDDRWVGTEPKDAFDSQVDGIIDPTVESLDGSVKLTKYEIMKLNVLIAKERGTHPNKAIWLEPLIANVLRDRIHIPAQKRRKTDVRK